MDREVSLLAEMDKVKAEASKSPWEPISVIFHIIPKYRIAE